MGRPLFVIVGRGRNGVRKVRGRLKVWNWLKARKRGSKLKAQQGLEVPAGLRHRILNESEEDLEFILCSATFDNAGDRINI